ncbi:substrate-binding domain-containing protein [Micromonospora andamanensis]|uniref:ABC transporter substrate-binding protein n=1 Tax=Micromonospora andamanensis TaxID=1287068 RepID=A0ABQ4HPQ7_9ACTN|nr:substrate-binding domain-containing protein [Micromonospora andamanensis]GIJ07607.1 ABC transporter substrate-binding protein [Micromonospora andamanensis]
MTVRTTRRVFISAATMMAAAIAATACGSPQDTANGGGDSAAPVKVGLVYSQSGALASYGKQYIEGFRAGLDFATNGTNKVGDRAIEITEVDDAGDPAKAVSAAKDLIGKGNKIIAGSTASGVALQVAPIAAQNKVLFISGPAATDAVTGANKYTFRSGRQSYQDVVTAKSFIGDPAGKKVVVFAQDGAFGDANEAAVKAVIGGAGASVSAVRAPASATEFTPFASQIKSAKPDLLFVAWAGTTAPAMWQTLDQQGVLTSTTVVTGLDIRASWPTFGAAGSKISFLSHYFDGASDTEAAKAAKAKVPGGTLDLFHPDGFAAAQMVVRAAAEGGDDVDKMVTALEGWSFESVKGTMTIRAEDHALLQPMYQASLTGSGDAFTATAQKALTGDETAPPVQAMKG